MASPERKSGNKTSGNDTVQFGVQRAAELFSIHGEDIRAIIDFHVGNRGDGDDIFQELFLSIAFARLPRDISNMRRYLYRSVMNDLASRFRQQKRYLRRVKIYVENRKYRALDDDPSRTVMRAEQICKVFETIENELPQREARAVACRYRYDYDTAEAADEMGVNKRSFSRYLCAGLKRIREIDLAQQESLR
ncbi:RNA polymerase sigma factor [Planctomycetota bacterium]